jgi:hypothetical protein
MVNIYRKFERIQCRLLQVVEAQAGRKLSLALQNMIRDLCDFRLPPRYNKVIRTSGMLRSVYLFLPTFRDILQDDSDIVPKRR